MSSRRRSRCCSGHFSFPLACDALDCTSIAGSGACTWAWAFLIGGLSGLYISQFAYGGVVDKAGFATLATCWLYTGLRAYPGHSSQGDRRAPEMDGAQLLALRLLP